MAGVTDNGNISCLLVTDYQVIHSGWRDGVLVQALSQLPRGMLWTLQHSQSLAEVSWELLMWERQGV